jgi:hypothetical protein
MMRPSQALTLLMVFAYPAMGQVRTRPAIADSSPARIMTRVGPDADALWLRDILRQSGAQYPQAKLDQIADSLVARAVDSRATVPRSDARTRALKAVNAISAAGSDGALTGRPYAPALDRLITVHRTAPGRDVRAHALAGMLNISSDRPRAIEYLRRVAESTDPTAYDAVEVLIADANGQGWGGVKSTASQQQQSIMALRALGSAHRVSNQAAATLLDVWIGNHPA